MPSKESTVLLDLYKDIKARMSQYSDLDIGWIRLILESLADPTAEPSDVTYEEIHCPGTIRPAIWVKPISSSSSHVVLYMHGGAGFAGSPSSHRKFVGHLAKATGCIMLMLDYRLAPEHAFPAAIEDVTAAFQWLLVNYDAKMIAFAGDSAGGNIAVSTVLKLKDAGATLPVAVAVFSPWLDMELKGETLKTNADKDVLSGPDALAMSAAMYLSGHSPDDPYANPLYGNMKGFPPLYVNAGSWENLLSDAERLVKIAKAANVDVVEEICEGMQHDYILMAGRAPEADHTIREVGKWLREKLDII